MNQVERAQELAARCTPEQKARREEVSRRSAAVQAGVKRGPNAPADRTFGGVKKPK